jgi:putative flippase GtrA
MTDETATRTPVPAALAAAGRLASFSLAGAAGYVVNLTVYALALHGLGVDYRLGAVIAFAFALSTTFALNRRFTFGARHGGVGGQAGRYLVVSVVAFGVSLAVLHALVEWAELPKLDAQALAIACAAPVNYLGQRLWAFAP